MSTIRRTVDESPAKVKTKIVATVGPSIREPEVMRALIRAGVDVFRLNLSHGTYDEHADSLARIRSLADELGRMVGVLLDLSGPKVRLGTLAEEVITCDLGQEFTLVPAPETGDAGQLTCNYPEIVTDLTPGEPVLFADGNVVMDVLAVDSGSARLRVTVPGPLRPRQGINVPHSALRLPSLTDKDLRDLDWAATVDVDFLALSFVRSGEDVARLREEMAARSIDAWVVSKIEKPQAIDRLEAILEQSDVVMVARGDLGVEVDVARVPALQKRIIREAHRARVPVITATQMLNSMERSNRPTRAEASDVFNAVLDGTDAVMLSGETAIGDYPTETVRTMARILRAAEEEVATDRPATPSPSRNGPAKAGPVSPITEAVVEAAAAIAERLRASLAIVATRTGRTALAASMQRGATPTIALNQDERHARRLSLLWGVIPLRHAPITDIDAALDFAIAWARDAGLASKGDRVVLIRGFIPDQPTHNALIVREID